MDQKELENIDEDDYDYQSFMVIGISDDKKYHYLHMAIMDENDFIHGNYEFVDKESTTYDGLLALLDDNIVDYINNNGDITKDYLQEDTCTCNRLSFPSELQTYNDDGAVNIQRIKNYCMFCSCACYLDGDCECEDKTCECLVNLNKAIPRPL
jgi:hypothetical protein